MRLFHRVLATTVASLALASAGVMVAAPASATPEDGKGCVGTPAVPASYICVISATPENVVPSVTTVNVPVSVPSICYFLDCTKPQTVNVPVPNVTPKSGVVAVLWYQGVYYPIGVGTVDEVTRLVWNTIDLAKGVAYTALGIAAQLADYGVQQVNHYVGVVGGIVEEAYYDVERIVNDLPTVDELVAAIVRYVQEEVYPTVRELQYRIREIRENLEYELAVLLERVDRLVQDLKDCIRYECFAVLELPDVKELIGRIDIGDIVSPME